MQQEASFLFPDEYERSFATRIRNIMDDPILGNDGYETVSGDSQLRPRTLYP